jgi:hypothetical protein
MADEQTAHGRPTMADEQLAEAIARKEGEPAGPATGPPGVRAGR